MRVGPMMFNVPDEGNAVATLLNLMREAGWGETAEQAEVAAAAEPPRADAREEVLAFIESALDREGYDCTDLKEAITALIVERDQAHKEVETLREEQRVLRDTQSRCNQMQAAFSDVHVVLDAAGVPNNGMSMAARVAWLAGRVGNKA